MKEAKNISTLFLDIGGVLLTNGCHKEFHLDTYELGKLTLGEYLNITVFINKDFENTIFRDNEGNIVIIDEYFINKSILAGSELFVSRVNFFV